MSEHMSPIPSRIYNAAVGGHVAGADQIIDDKTGLTLDKVTGGALEEKTYTSSSDNGMGRVVLRKNLVEGVNTLVQTMINKSNTIYVIQYDFTLDEDITVPDNCVLEFEGGSVNNSINGNYKLTGQNTTINTDNYTQILSNVILYGTYKNTYLSICNFGIKEGDYSVENGNTLVTYVIPSLENIGAKLIIPRGSYKYDTPIITSGLFDIECVGSLVYTGNVNTTALTISNNGSAITGKYIIKLSLGYDIRSYYSVDGNNVTVPDNYGLIIIGAHGCDIDIDVTGFAYCVEFKSTSAGFAYNNINLHTIGGYPYKALILSAEDSGYVNENVFYGGDFRNWSGNPVAEHNVALTLISNTTHLVNNNVFVKPCIESFSLGVYFYKAYYNTIYSGRFEAVTTPINFRNNIDTRCNVVICGYSANIGTIENNNVNNNCFTYLNNMIPSDTYRTVFDGIPKIFSSSNSKVSNLHGIYYNGGSPTNIIPSGIYYYGVIVDTNVVKQFVFHSSQKVTLGVAILDENMNNITDASTIETYMTNIGMVEGKVCRSSENAVTDRTIVFKTPCKYAFIGVKQPDRYLYIAGKTTAQEDLRVYPSSTPLFQGNFVPTSGTNLNVGDRMFNTANSKFYSWNGSSIVEG